MFACLLLGAVLLFASAVSFPIYRTAVLDRMLDDQFEEYMTTTGNWPMSTIPSIIIRPSTTPLLRILQDRMVLSFLLRLPLCPG